MAKVLFTKAEPVVQHSIDWTKNIIVNKLVTGANETLTIEEFAEAVIKYLSAANVEGCSREEAYHKHLLAILGKFSQEFTGELHSFDNEQARVRNALVSAGIPDVEVKVNELFRNKLAKAKEDARIAEEQRKAEEAIIAAEQEAARIEAERKAEEERRTAEYFTATESEAEQPVEQNNLFND